MTEEDKKLELLKQLHELQDFTGKEKNWSINKIKKAIEQAKKDLSTNLKGDD